MALEEEFAPATDVATTDASMTVETIEAFNSLSKQTQFLVLCARVNRGKYRDRLVPDCDDALFELVRSQVNGRKLSRPLGLQSSDPSVADPAKFDDPRNKRYYDEADLLFEMMHVYMKPVRRSSPLRHF